MTCILSDLYRLGLTESAFGTKVGRRTNSKERHENAYG